MFENHLKKLENDKQSRCFFSGSEIHNIGVEDVASKLKHYFKLNKITGEPHISSNLVTVDWFGNFVVKLAESDNYVLIEEEDRFVKCGCEGDEMYSLIEYKGEKYLVSQATTFKNREEIGTTEYALFRQGYVLKVSPTGKEMLNAKVPNHTRFNEIKVEDQPYAVLTENITYDLSGSCITHTIDDELLTSNGEKWHKCEIRKDLSYVIKIDLLPKNSKSNVLSLLFESVNTHASEAWRKIYSLQKNYFTNNSLMHTPHIAQNICSFFHGDEDKLNCLQQLQNLVDEINKTQYISKISPNGKLIYPDVSNLDSNILNLLHYEYENYGDRYSNGESEVTALGLELYGIFNKLNNIIHATESALNNSEVNFLDGNYYISCDFIPHIVDHLASELLQEFTPDYKFGTLYMGYDTLGKSWDAVFWSNDIEAVNRCEVRSQKISNASILCYFGHDLSCIKERMQEWWQANNINSLGYEWDAPDNAFGLLPVAQLIVPSGMDREFILKKLMEYKSVKAVSVFC